MKIFKSFVASLGVVAAVFAVQISHAASQQCLSRVGQLMMVGFDETAVSANSPIVQEIKNYHIGGVIIADHYSKTGKSRNISSPTQLKQLVHDLQKYAKQYNDYPLLIAVNQEGGSINTLLPVKGFKLPLNYSQLELGSKYPNLIYQQALQMGQLLHKYGVNVNLAPVSALNINPKNPAIGALGRTFGRNPESVSQDIERTIRAYDASGVLCTLKHFPGIASADANTDLSGMVDVSKTWSPKELTPYTNAIE